MTECFSHGNDFQSFSITTASTKLPQHFKQLNMLFSRVAVAALTKRSVMAPVSRLARASGPTSSALSWSPRWMSTVEVPRPPTSHHRHVPLTNPDGTIIYTETDEAPALATYSLYPAVAKVSPFKKCTVLVFCKSADSAFLQFMQKPHEYSSNHQ